MVETELYTNEEKITNKRKGSTNEDLELECEDLKSEISSLQSKLSSLQTIHSNYQDSRCEFICRSLKKVTGADYVMLLGYTKFFIGDTIKNTDSTDKLTSFRSKKLFESKRKYNLRKVHALRFRLDKLYEDNLHFQRFLENNRETLDILESFLYRVSKPDFDIELRKNEEGNIPINDYKKGKTVAELKIFSSQNLKSQRSVHK